MDLKTISYSLVLSISFSMPIFAQEPASLDWESLVSNQANQLSKSEIIESLAASSKSLWTPVSTPQMMQVNDGVGDLGWIVSDNKDTVLFKICDQKNPIKLKRQLLEKTDKTCDDGVPEIPVNSVIAHYSKESDKLELFEKDEFLKQLLERPS